MTSAFCCGNLGIVPTVHHGDDIGSWLGMLPEDNRAVIRAASAPPRRTDYLLAFRAVAVAVPGCKRDAA